MDLSIEHEVYVNIEDVPIQWILNFEPYYPDLPGFPTIYVHYFYNSKRFFGFPVSISFDLVKNDICTVNICFLCNRKIVEHSKEYNRLKEELCERFGSSNAIELSTIKEACGTNTEYFSFFSELWKYVSTLYGEKIPYGKFYEEIYSIVRFVSAWQPKTGRQSEMRMLYNFLSSYGTRIKIKSPWDFLEFYLLPTYEEVINNDFVYFNKFDVLYKGMQKMWIKYFTKELSINGVVNRFLASGWPKNKEEFNTEILDKVSFNNEEEKMAIENLVDSFNRHPWRAAYFIWSIMSIRTKDYREWDKNYMLEFYKFSGFNKTKGSSPKAISCFLQQGFKNCEIIPIDTWVETFYNYCLSIPSKEIFFSKFFYLGKIERVIWLSSQANKTNIQLFFDILWCQRYGTIGNKEYRGKNPIACYQCKLIEKCPGYDSISNDKIYLFNNKDKDSLDTAKLVATSSNVNMICELVNYVPKKIYIKKPKSWQLIDEFSGYRMSSYNKTNLSLGIYSIKDFVASLPKFQFDIEDFKSNYEGL